MRKELERIASSLDDEDAHVEALYVLARCGWGESSPLKAEVDGAVFLPEGWNADGGMPGERRETMMIGDKECCAVELNVARRGAYAMGYVRLWLKGQFLGSIEEEEMLSSFVHSLEWIGGMNEIETDALDFGDAEAEFAWIQDHDLMHDRCLACLGESTDDFHVRAYRKGERLRFMWRLVNQPFHSYPGYGNELRCADIGREKFLDVAKAARAEIDDWTNGF